MPQEVTLSEVIAIIKDWASEDADVLGHYHQKDLSSTIHGRVAYVGGSLLRIYNASGSMKIDLDEKDQVFREKPSEGQEPGLVGAAAEFSGHRFDDFLWTRRPSGSHFLIGKKSKIG